MPRGRKKQACFPYDDEENALEAGEEVKSQEEEMEEAGFHLDEEGGEEFIQPEKGLASDGKEDYENVSLRSRRRRSKVGRGLLDEYADYEEEEEEEVEEKYGEDIEQEEDDEEYEDDFTDEEDESNPV